MGSPFFEVRGLDEVLRRLDGASKYVPEELEEATDEIGDAARKELSDYPAPRPGQRYVRTGDLGRGWLNSKPRPLSSTRGIVGFRLINPVSYTRFVQGDPPDQAWMHKGRWKTIGQVVMRLSSKIRGELEKAGRRVAHRMTTE